MSMFVQSERTPFYLCAAVAEWFGGKVRKAKMDCGTGFNIRTL